VAARSLDEFESHYGICVKKITRVLLIGTNPAHGGCCVDYDLRLIISKQTFGRSTLCEVALGMRGRHDFATSTFAQPVNDVTAEEPVATRYKNPLTLDISHGHTTRAVAPRRQATPRAARLSSIPSSYL
jgi:hypothetical protein